MYSMSYSSVSYSIVFVCVLSSYYPSLPLQGMSPSCKGDQSIPSPVCVRAKAGEWNETRGRQRYCSSTSITQYIKTAPFGKGISPQTMILNSGSFHHSGTVATPLLSSAGVKGPHQSQTLILPLPPPSAALGNVEKLEKSGKNNFGTLLTIATTTVPRGTPLQN